MPSRALRSWTPPALARWAARRLGRAQHFERVPGDTWQAAQARSTGYDSDTIVRRVVEATRAVVAGPGAFERDSVVFPQWQAPFQLLAPLLRHALRHDGQLDVVDFGGSLGSSYRQCMPFLPRLSCLRWQVVEQPRFVAAGREFADETLTFHAAIDQLPPCDVPRILLVSSVAQYLPDPARLWVDAGAAAAGIDAIVIDRTPVWAGDRDLACVQHVPRHIYAASYPCWILSEQRLLGRFSDAWELAAQFESAEGRHEVTGGGPEFLFKGFVFERRAS